MLLHERPIHYVDHNYESRGVSLLHAKRYDFILRDGWGIECMYRVPIHPYVQVAPLCKSPPICKVTLPTPVIRFPLFGTLHYFQCIKENEEEVEGTL